MNHCCNVKTNYFSGVFAARSSKIAPVTFIMSVHPCTAYSLTTREPLKGFPLNLILGTFITVCRYTNILVKLKQGLNCGKSA